MWYWGQHLRRSSMYTKLEGLCLSETSKPYHVRFIQLSILTHVRGFKGMYRCCGFRVTSHNNCGVTLAVTCCWPHIEVVWATIYKCHGQVSHIVEHRLTETGPPHELDLKALKGYCFLTYWPPNTLTYTYYISMWQPLCGYIWGIKDGYYQCWVTTIHDL